jgi:PAS domain S-box-containing protein
VGIYRNTVGPKGKFLEANPAIVEMFGFDSREEFLEVRVSDLYRNPNDRKEYNAKLLKEGTVRNEELQLQKKGGTSFLGSISAVVVKDEKGEVKYYDGIIEDITDRKRAEEALLVSEEKHRHLFETAMIGIYRTRIEDGKFLAANQKMANMLGYETVDRLVEEYVTSIHYTDPKLRKELLDQLQSQKRVDDFEIEMTRTDGSTIQIALSATAYPDRGYLEGFIVDITQRKQAEAALRESKTKLERSKKMKSLGLLAGGVAHDLNNVLSGIVSYPELILLDLPEDSNFREPIETIKESGHRAVAIVQDLLTVARGVAITKEPLNLNDLVSDYLHSPEFNKLKQFHPIVTVKTKLDIDIFNISGSHVHIRKVLMNLVSNAAEAVEGSGNITISTMNRYLDRPLRGYDDMNIGEYVVLSVSDEGSGISSDDLERIFEPFYTKKVMGRSGTGLALAVVWNIMLDHKGYIDVKNKENGTTFELYLPITRDEILGKGLSLRIDNFRGDGETILVVDDIETQREISCKMLNTLGYKTKTVSSGEEAVEYLKENTVDLLLLDMIMDPGINGRETYEMIIEIHPNQKAIIVSGFAETDDVREAQKLGAGQYIQKPVTLEKIGIAIKEELGKQYSTL